MINKQKYIKFFFFIVCVLQIFYLFQIRSGFKYEIIKNPFNENSGVNYAVSPEIIESNNILKNNNLTSFNLSENLLNDTYFYQRSIEFNYPIKIKEDSNFIIYNINESILNTCIIMETGKYIKLVKC